MTVYQPKCPQVIEYRIDHHDRILQVSDSWRRFAVENNAPVKVLEAVGDSLWDHIYDSGTQDLYSLLLDSVRLSQQPLSFPYRCDSPSVKRFMAMTMVCEPLEEVLGAAGHPLERGRRVLGALEEDHLHLVELVDPQDPPRVLPGGARLAAEAGGVGGVADRELGGLEDLVAVEVRHRDLGRRDQVELVARDDVHLVFLVRDLAGHGVMV